MTKPKTLEQLRTEKERAETQLAQEKHMTSIMSRRVTSVICFMFHLQFRKVFI